MLIMLQTFFGALNVLESVKQLEIKPYHPFKLKQQQF